MKRIIIEATGATEKQAIAMAIRAVANAVSKEGKWDATICTVTGPDGEAKYDLDTVKPS